MYKRDKYRIRSNKKIAQNVYEMILEGDTTYIIRPGQFINIELDGFYLRRPISVCDYDNETITIIYKVVGNGTEKMATLKAGEILDILTGLGNGFEVKRSGEKPLLIGYDTRFLADKFAEFVKNYILKVRNEKMKKYLRQNSNFKNKTP